MERAPAGKNHEGITYLPRALARKELLDRLNFFQRRAHGQSIHACWLATTLSQIRFGRGPDSGCLSANRRAGSYLREAEVTIWVPIHCGKFFKVVVLLGARKKFFLIASQNEASKK
jgi:hypothetical protein